MPKVEELQQQVEELQQEYEELDKFCDVLRRDRNNIEEATCNNIARDLGETYYFDFVYWREHPEEVPQDEVSLCMMATMENIFSILKRHGVDCNKYYRG